MQVNKHGESLLEDFRRRGPKDLRDPYNDTDLEPDYEALPIFDFDDLSYTASDFGDRDSLNSVHGWSDDETDD
jgi:hypothetical protein